MDQEHKGDGRRAAWWAVVSAATIGLALFSLDCNSGSVVATKASYKCKDKTVTVDDSLDAGVDQEVVLLCGGDTNKITWDGRGKKFNIDFAVSPFKDGTTHFDETHNVSDVPKNPSAAYEYQKYSITINGGQPHDPGVIIVR